MAAFVSCAVEQLTFLRGEPTGYRASERAVRQFCPTCGSTLFWREDGSSEVDICLGTFDEPSRLPPPRFAIWAQHRVSWLPEIAGIPAYAEGRSA